MYVLLPWSHEDWLARASTFASFDAARDARDNARDEIIGPVTADEAAALRGAFERLAYVNHFPNQRPPGGDPRVATVEEANAARAVIARLARGRRYPAVFEGGAS